METIVKKQETIRHHIKDIAVDISFAKLAKKYFGKSPSWMYHKINGIDGNGSDGGFSESEKEQFKGALYDLSDRIRKVAEKIK